MHRPSAILVSSALVLVLLAAACASKATSGASAREEKLTQAATTLWDAKVKKDWGTVYDLTTAAYKQRVTKADFLASSLVEIKAYTIKKVTIDQTGDTAQVEVAATIAQAGFDFPAAIKDKWQLENGSWHYVPATVPLK